MGHPVVIGQSRTGWRLHPVRNGATGTPDRSSFLEHPQRRAERCACGLLGRRDGARRFAFPNQSSHSHRSVRVRTKTPCDVAARPAGDSQHLAGPGSFRTGGMRLRGVIWTCLLQVASPMLIA